MKTKSKALSLLTCASMLAVSVTGCQPAVYEPAVKVNAQNLLEGISLSSISTAKPEEDFLTHMADLSLSILRKEGSISPGENWLFSPLSFMMALSLTANGAENQTLSQMEAVLGADRDSLNRTMAYYREALTSQSPKIQTANSLWIKKDGFSPNEDFLQTAADYYRPDVYTAPFDNTTLSDINQWVSGKTEGQIPKILDEISEDAALYIINTLLFDGKWETPYEERQISSGKFFTEDGESHVVPMMKSIETQYLENDLAAGFLKSYEGGRYAFGALLPRTKGSFGQFLAQLDGETLQTTIQNPRQEEIYVSLPKFSFDDSLSLPEHLKALGMTDAFSGKDADFSSLGTADGTLYISQVIQKTHIAVSETGTQASAATEVGFSVTGSLPEILVVSLDRPFLFFIVDQESGALLFLGAVTHIEDTEE